MHRRGSLSGAISRRCRYLLLTFLLHHDLDVRGFVLQL